MVKKVIINSSNDDREFNLKIFSYLVRELRTKLDIAKRDLAPDKIKQAIIFGLDPNSKEYEGKKQRRIERMIL